MNILVIKQTSLGDVLHASGHIRAIKQKYPDSVLTLLTDIHSEPVYRHNPWVDEIILIDRYGIKRNWFRHPVWTAKEIRRVSHEVRLKNYDLAFDLQGLARSVIFLYLATASHKFVKGRWWGLKGFRDKGLHAIREMDQVLVLSGINPENTNMEFHTGPAESTAVDTLMEKLNPDGRPLLVISPYSRWPSKDWPLVHYVAVSEAMSDRFLVAFTGTGQRSADIETGLGVSANHGAVNLAGRLSMLEFVELIGRATLMLTGDSFPMHVAVARGTSVVALFGPTDETRVGPLGKSDKVLRVDGCDICDRKNCPRQCLQRLLPDEVIAEINSRLPHDSQGAGP